MGEVRHGPKGANEGGTGVLIEEERNRGAHQRGEKRSKRGGRRGHGGAHRRGEKWWCDGGGPVGQVRTQGRREMGRRVMGCSGMLAREDERGKKGEGVWR
jgi:hypothetical protein